MLIIDCPYCGPRPELEFSYAGQAHIVRPIDPSAVDADAWAGYLYLRANTRGVHAERWRHTARLRALLQRAARHHDRSFRRDLSLRRAAPGMAGGRGHVSAHRLARRRPHRQDAADPIHVRRSALTRDTPATRSPRRCSRTVSGCSVAPSSITARADCSVQARRSRTRSSPSCATPPGARRICARPRSSSTRVSSPRARIAGPRSRST